MSKRVFSPWEAYTANRAYDDQEMGRAIARWVAHWDRMAAELAAPSAWLRQVLPPEVPAGE